MYVRVFERLGTTLPLSAKVKDWKSAVQQVVKTTQQWHFKFNSAKRFLLTKSTKEGILVRGEMNYYNNVGIGLPIIKKTEA